MQLKFKEDGTSEKGALREGFHRLEKWESLRSN